MSTSYYVLGIKPPDETWLKMKAVYDACEAAGADIFIPDKVDRYFEGEAPDPNGVIVEIDTEEWNSEDGYRSGYDVDLTKLPEGIKILRFVIS